MIPFDEIDERLEKLGKTRKWLAAETGRSENSIRLALAPNAPEKQRSKLLQKALSDAIQAEENERDREIGRFGHHPIPDRLTIEASAEDQKRWRDAAHRENKQIDQWVVDALNEAAHEWKGERKMDALLAEPDSDQGNQHGARGA